MKKLLALVIALATPCLLLSAEKPDGMLGTNSISVLGLYSNVDMGHYESGLDLDYAGIGLELNQSLYVKNGSGMDLNISHNYTTNQNNTADYSVDSHDTFVGLTIYHDGMFAPFFRPVAGYSSSRFDNGTITNKEDTWLYGADAGVEMHLIRGLSITPCVSYMSGSDVSSYTNFGLDLNYWINERLAVVGGATYNKQDHVKSTDLFLGMALHY